MIHLILDTNIYTHNPSRDKPGFQTLKWLSDSNELQLYIPYVVKREFQTQQKEVCENSMRDIENSLKNLKKRFFTPKTEAFIKEVGDTLSNYSDTILSEAEKEFELWFKTLKAKEIHLCSKQAKQALESYFQGTAPLKAPKIRKDIPDSFVARAIEKVLSDVGELMLIIHDKNLREAMDEYKETVVFQTLDDFISSEYVQELLLDLSVLENYDILKDELEVIEDNTSLFSAAIERLIGEAIVYKEIQDSSIPDDNGIATIQMYEEPTDIEIDFEKTIYFGDSKIGLPFDLKIDVSAYFLIYKADFHTLGDQMKYLSVSEHNNHYYEAEDDFSLIVSGVLTAKIDEKVVLETGTLNENIDSDSLLVEEIISIELTD